MEIGYSCLLGKYKLMDKDSFNFTIGISSFCEMVVGKVDKVIEAHYNSGLCALEDSTQ